MSAEIRKFTLHPEIIFSIIHAQAGRLSKAIAEGVMNAVDAGATKISIDLNTKSYVIDDDGGGFKSREEIEEFFEKFGTPHKEGDATYGRFRMGRGQLMSFSSTVWRSGAFCMDVDVKRRGVDYHLNTMPNSYGGCRIEGILYDPLLPSEVESVCREIEEMVRFVNVPIVLNGECVSRDPVKEKWDVETPDAYIKLRAAGGLKVYNLGVFVREYSSHQFGTGGIVVSKTALQVNFARNEVLFNRCSVWKRIATKLKTDADRRTSRKAAMTAEERDYLASQIAIGAVDYEKVGDAKVFTDVTGKHVSLRSFCSDLYRMPFTVAPEKGSRIGEKAHKTIAYVLAPETLDRFGVDTAEDLRTLLAKVRGIEHAFINAKTCSFAEIAASYSDRYEILKADDLTAQQSAMLSAISDNTHILTYGMMQAGYLEHKNRFMKIYAGVSDTALGWTDAATYVALHIDRIDAALRDGYAGILNIGAILVHELLHSDGDLADHGHPPEFYEAFHNIVCSVNAPLARFADQVMASYVAELRKIAKRVPKRYLKQADATARAEAGAAKLDEAIEQQRAAA